MGSLNSYHVAGNLDARTKVNQTFMLAVANVPSTCLCLLVGNSAKMMLLLSAAFQGFFAWKLYPVYKVPNGGEYAFPSLLCQQAMLIAFITSILLSVSCIRLFEVLAMTRETSLVYALLINTQLLVVLVTTCMWEWMCFKKHHGKSPVSALVNLNQQGNSNAIRQTPFFGGEEPVPAGTGGYFNANPNTPPAVSGNVFQGEGHRLGED
eukprot:GHVH01010760.1.p1 GENE.GHVH01010760.1~~GHVH01010760.1.p1  ORF type:complete len:216 (+),score=5.08 GHVH01010760.1:27-650(+)